MSGRRSYRALVTGSRDFDDPVLLYGALSGVLASAGLPMVIVHGACPTGADALASRWARANAVINWPVVSEEPHPADWSAHGKAAGPVRNAEMVALGADVCLVFAMPCTRPGCHGKAAHDSHGTADCAARAAKAGIPVRRFKS